MTQKKQIKYVAEIPGDDGVIMHNGDEKPMLFDTPEAAFFEGQDMNGVSMMNAAFIVRALTESDVDEDDEQYADVLLVDTDEEEHYPIYVGHNGVKWVREWYMQILFEVLQPEPNWHKIDQYRYRIPVCDLNLRTLEALIQQYKERTDVG